VIKKIVQVSVGVSFDGGGAALHGRLLARGLADYCAHQRMDFEVLHLGLPTDVISPIRVTHFDGHQLSMMLKIWQCSLDRTTAIVFDHLGPARAFGVLPRLLRRPYALSMLGIEVWEPLSWERRAALEGAHLRLSISRYTEQRARLISPWLPEVKVLHLALEECDPQGDIDAGLVERLGVGYILIVGRLTGKERYKGHDELLEALPAVLHKVPYAKLVIVGKGNDQPRLEAVARDLDITSHVVFTGFVSEATLEQLYKHCGVFVMPSRKEGFGLVFLEAMKARKPTIALRDSSVAEIIVDGETGILIDNYGAELEQALTRLLQDTELAHRMGEAGHERWKNVFSFERYKSTLQQYLDEWLDQI
jgi:phosphatidylinositol alpha-1,6-mannosyltransferase